MAAFTSISNLALIYWCMRWSRHFRMEGGLLSNRARTMSQTTSMSCADTLVENTAIHLRRGVQWPPSQVTSLMQILR